MEGDVTVDEYHNMSEIERKKILKEDLSKLVLSIAPFE